MAILRRLRMTPSRRESLFERNQGIGTVLMVGSLSNDKEDENLCQEEWIRGR